MAEKKKIILAILLPSAAVVFLLVALPGAIQAQTPQADKEQTTSMTRLSPMDGAAEFRAALDTREKLLIEKVNTHPSLLQYMEGAKGLDMNFVPATIFGEDTDKMYISVKKDRGVVGDWRTEYHVTYTNNFEIVVDFDGDQIKNISVNKAPNETIVIDFSDKQKSLISLALQNATVLERLDGRDWHIRNVYSSIGYEGDDRCPHGDCHSITIDQNTRQETLGVAVNSATGKVVFIGSSPGW